MPLMPWLLKSPGHQQARHWLCGICNIHGFSRVNFICLYQPKPKKWYKIEIHLLQPLKQFSTLKVNSLWLSDTICRARLFSKSSLARLQEFWNSSICLYEIKKKYLSKSTCPTGSFTCPGPSGSGKRRALASLLQVMACWMKIEGTKPSPELVLTYYHLDFKKEHYSMKIELQYSKFHPFCSCLSPVC